MTRPKKKRKFSREELIERVFARVARVIFELWEEGRGDTRLLDDPFIPDEFVVAGTSKQGGGRREHVIPRLMIYDRCLEMYENQTSIGDVAKFIRRHLIIVHISRDEQNLIDKTLGLKTRMPDGWEFEKSDIYARLKIGGIEFA
ncbi:MAG: hypothetical protein K9J74_01285 [Sulfuritalea sp.]|nr:hypothetical protein [Sulfuritalea sp.]